VGDESEPPTKRRALSAWDVHVRNKSLGSTGRPNTKELSASYRLLSPEELQELQKEADQSNGGIEKKPLGPTKRDAERGLKRRQTEARKQRVEVSAALVVQDDDGRVRRADRCANAVQSAISSGGDLVTVVQSAKTEIRSYSTVVAARERKGTAETRVWQEGHGKTLSKNVANAFGINSSQSDVLAMPCAGNLVTSVWSPSRDALGNGAKRIMAKTTGSNLGILLEEQFPKIMRPILHKDCEAIPDEYAVKHKITLNKKNVVL
jgi:hypothetical protein